MPRKKNDNADSEKVGIVHVRPLGPDRWALRWRPPGTRRDVRRIHDATPRRDLDSIIAHINEEARISRGDLPRSRSRAPELMEGVRQALALTRASAAVNVARTWNAQKFADWMAANHPYAPTWSDVMPAHLRAYLLALEKADLKYDTIRLRLAPLKLAWRYAMENWPDSVRPMPTLRLKRPAARSIKSLEPTDALILLAWLDRRAPAVAPIAALMGLAGLRMLEAAALRVHDYHAKTKTITIIKTELHTPKTPDSYRTIPILPELAARLESAIGERTAGPIFTNDDGEPWCKGALSHHLTAAIRRAAATPETFKRKGTGWPLTRNPHGLSMPGLAAHPARKLRSTFSTLAGQARADRDILKAYMGHSPGDTMGKHYQRYSLAQLAEIPAQIGNKLAELRSYISPTLDAINLP